MLAGSFSLGYNGYVTWTEQGLASGGYVYLAYPPLGLRVLDASDPGNISEVGSYDTFGSATGITIEGGLVYVSAGRDGLYILRHQPPLDPHLDVQPGSCTNMLNVRPFVIERGTTRRPRGLLPVALLGDDGFDVHDVDVSSVRLEGVPALRHGHLDVASVPPGGDDPVRPGEGPDGTTDLMLWFDRADVVEAVGATDGLTPLTLVGNLLDGTSFGATDWVQVAGTGRGVRLRWRLVGTLMDWKP